MIFEDPNYYIQDKALMKKIKLFEDTGDEFMKSKNHLLALKIQ